MMRPVVCGNFEYDTRHEDLQRLFSKHGRVDRLDMKSDVMNGLDEDDMNEPTMAEKLSRNTTVTTPQEPPLTSNPPTADSVHVLLKQALHADDHALLLDCLYTRDEKVIAKSTSLLNPADVLKLLKSITSMLQSRGAVLICALPWVKSILCQHASSIVSQESSLLLNSFYQLSESRISTFGSALQLSTCIDNLFARIPDDEADEESMIPPIVYEDKDSDSDDEEVEDAMETDEDSEDPGAVTDSRTRDSDESEVMSD